MSISNEVLQQADLQFRHYLVDLQRESLRLIATCTGVASYLLIWLLIWPATQPPRPALAWTASLLLAGGSLIALVWPNRRQQWVSHLLIWSVFGAVYCGVAGLQLSAMIYLFILPVVFASVLLNRQSVFLVAACAIATLFFLGTGPQGERLPTQDLLLSLLIIALVTIAAWLSAQKLYVALRWFASAYGQASENERQARDRQAELQRILKMLDEANYRVERANVLLATARDQAEEARRLKQHFVQNISHELRTPLNLIIGFTELMTRSPESYGSQLPQAYVRDLSVVYRNACHLQSLVNDVLDLSRIDAMQMTLQLEVSDLGLIVQEAVQSVEPLATARRLALQVAIEPALPFLLVDPTRIRQVVLNLLSNAVRFTSQGHVAVRVERSEREVLVAVSDTGPGIPPEQLARVFEEFHQVDGDTRRLHGGAGLGLAISQQFIRLHGGRIWVESQLGVGSTFYFALPVEFTPGGGLHFTSGQRALDAYSLPNGQRLLLCVTPSPAGAAFLTRRLNGYRILVTSELEQGRQIAEQTMPQAVLIDTAQAALTRAQLRQLTETWGLPNVPFIAAPLPGDASLRERLAVDGYLVKPVLWRNLLDLLRQLGPDTEQVLIVDDDRDFVRLLRSMLNSTVRRYQISAAYSGEEALALLRHRRPDVLLLDLNMPGMDGLGLIDCIRSNPSWATLPIIVISAQDEIDEAQPLAGPVLLSKESGMRPGELIRWIQSVLDSAPGPRAHPVV